MARRLSHQDISMLIADIDGDDGVIDYEEFVRFAVVMFQAFRARNFGQKRADEDYVAMTVEIDKMMKVQRLAEVSERCMKMFRMHDTAGSGYLRPSEVHRAMDEAGGGLSPWEVGCKSLLVTGLGGAHFPLPLPRSFLLALPRYCRPRRCAKACRGTGSVASGTPGSPSSSKASVSSP